jgi:hypothetical protein
VADVELVASPLVDVPAPVPDSDVELAADGASLHATGTHKTNDRTLARLSIMARSVRGQEIEPARSCSRCVRAFGRKRGTMRRVGRGVAWALMAALFGCGRHVDVLERVEGSAGGDAEDTSSAVTSTSSPTSTSSGADDDDDGASSGPPPPDDCSVPLPTSALVPCGRGASGDPITPVLEWSWGGVDSDRSVIVTPLVASLTDDDGNGTIDTCDVPDVVAVAYDPQGDGSARVYVLDGATGAVHTTASLDVDAETTPALGDLDGDRVAEIVTVSHDGELVVLAANGSVRAVGDAAAAGVPLALADLDADGSIEIVHPAGVYDDEGRLQWAIDPPENLVAADADGDGTLELLGGRGFRHDGTSYYDAGIVGWPQIADLDDDPDPEIVVAHESGVVILDHTGVVQSTKDYPGVTPEGPKLAAPAAIADLDGDGDREIAARTATTLVRLEADLTVTWSRPVMGGTAGPAAFDLQGTGASLVLFADTTRLVGYDGAGTERFVVQRSSASLVELPVVVDVDGDGAAELIVVNNASAPTPTLRPAVQVYGDGTGGWVDTRRVWNQHAYAVTNVEDNGTIPTPMSASWRTVDTFRANARVMDGMICAP